MVGCSKGADIIETKNAPAPAASVGAAKVAETPVAEEASASVVPTSLNQGGSDSSIGETMATSIDQEPQKPTLAEYTPPFPDRVDLFVPPKRQGGMVLKEGGSEDAVELLGFVRLDKQQVVLSVNGQLTTIAQGGSQYGIEVISIQPPKVVLQRGRQRWQASLEQ